MEKFCKKLRVFVGMDLNPSFPEMDPRIRNTALLTSLIFRSAWSNGKFRLKQILKKTVSVLQVRRDL